MRRIALLLLALLLFLPACGRVGASNGVRLRTLDLDDEANAETIAWLEEWYVKWESIENPKSLRLSETETVYRKEDTYLEGKVMLRDEQTGKETVLLEDKYLGERNDPYQDEVHWIRPIPQKAIDDRFFVVVWSGWESQGGVSVYDTKEMREIPLINETWLGDYFLTYGNHIYLTTHEHFTIYSADGKKEYGPLSLQKAEATSEMGETLLAVELLEEYPGAETDAVILGSSDLSPDERYFVANEGYGVLICDLKEKRPAWHIPFPASKYGFKDVVFRDAHIIYCFNADAIFDENSNVIGAQVYDALEITLP